MTEHHGPQGIIPAIVRTFLQARLSVMFILFALGLGIAAILTTPREEEPQIVVPMADIFVHFPGASVHEVEQLVATPLEKLLWQVDGVEDVYSTCQRDMAVVTVRFFVGENREDSLIKLHNQIISHQDEAPPGLSGWAVKPVEIDDVPIVCLTLYSDRYDDAQLRRIGEEVLTRLSEIPDISATSITGGRRREIRVELLPQKLSGFGVSPMEVFARLHGADDSVTAGTLTSMGTTMTVSSDSFLQSADDVRSLVVGVHDGRPVYLGDVARVVDGPEEPVSYSRINLTPSHPRVPSLQRSGGERATYPAVTLALAKKRGTNAVKVARDILARMAALEKTVLPDGIHVEVTRNYGHTAQVKVNELLSNLFFAIVTVVGLLALTLGWREALVVALAVPISFSLALFVNHLLGYTINRVTLFALILSLGLVVDDPITNVENIQRHIRAGDMKPRQATLFAVREVLPPVIMSTLAIIACFLPLFFITGMMGPYMAPMAANVPLTVTFSTLCAITIVPWMSHVLLRKQAAPARALPVDPVTTPVGRAYRATVLPLLNSRVLRWTVFFLILIMLAGSLTLVYFRQVPLKMLPFDNKNELQIVLDMDEGTSLENTDRVIGELERYLTTVPEIISFVSYTGTASPMDFNSMVRHYFLRGLPHQADIRINLADKDKRVQQSHAIGLRIRKDLTAIARRHNARLKLVESPPGPPVFSTITAEIYGTPDMTYDQLLAGAAHVRAIMEQEPAVVDVDDTSETLRNKLDFVLDKEKAALHGVDTQNVVQTLTAAIKGLSPGLVHLEHERQPLRIRLTLPRALRSDVTGLGQIPVKTSFDTMIPLAELGTFERIPQDRTIMHKNLERVVYVTGEMAGQAPAEAILDMQKTLRAHPPAKGIRVNWRGEGEWKITVDVFRDMGIAFGVALLGIYVLLILQTGSMVLPLLIMAAIPLTLLGIMPGFWLLNLLMAHPVGGFANPVFFTATSMIGMIALGGIVIRNSLVLIEFIQDAVRQGMHLKEAILTSGAIRLRPIVLTALTTALGAWPITLDPIFSGLAWALIFGLFASTAFSLIVVPVAYFAMYDKQTG
ncbi:efflux RND transporter permease subunit [Desulfoplanes formicivorans]|uniref:Acriflavine resistance protein B n=1 Tax=Desulfoplanes formicivorans TaxID=1592317 RepID=A0A194AGG6_9BACT|nr:efflux RND transporter permease subunit [Desulfoplanes formicivorans]GAU08176.1 acriflavine resistance protein B [Desulfoplanes formicivorans]